MQILKKILKFLGDFGVGLLYLALTLGLLLLIAGAMFYFKPQELVVGAAALPQNPKGADALRGLQLMKWGAEGLAASALALWLERKLARAWKRRQARKAKEAEAAAEAAPKEAP